jgi:DNA-binding PadR family transcriptional regulator
MRSLVNWALLGIVIERPSYAYELARRFERTYGDALSLSSISHVYTALGTLKERALVEEIAGTRDARQPKPHYRATDRGVQAYGEWLVGQIGEERQRQRLFALALSTLTQHHEIALGILDRYERACLEQAREHPLAAGEEEDAGEDVRDAQLGARLAGEDTHLTAEAKLAWIDYARREIERRAGRTARGA